MFPEVWYADITNQSNNEKRQLIGLAGKNGMNQGFTGLRAFLPSEQYWVFEWFWNVCLIQLLSTTLVRRNRVIITDGDPNFYEPLRLAQSKISSPWYNSDHKLCQFHLIAQPWQVQIISLAKKIQGKLKYWTISTSGVQVGFIPLNQKKNSKCPLKNYLSIYVHLM